MNTQRPNKFLPCLTFFANDRPVAGGIAILLQATLIFWPVAARWAYVSQERSGIERLLGELSENNRLTVDPYGCTPKKFRQLA